MPSYEKGGTTPNSGVRMCQRLLVGYRLELVAICVHMHAMPYMKKYLRMGEMVESSHAAGDTAGFMQSKLQYLSFLETMWCCGLTFMLVWLVACLHMYYVLCSFYCACVCACMRAFMHACTCVCDTLLCFPCACTL